MLCVTTSDSWTFSVTVTVAAYAAQTYTNASTANNAQLASQGLLAYLNNPARPWAGVVTWTLTQSRSNTAGMRYTFACANIFTLSGGAAATLGLAAGAYAGSATSTTDAAGTLYLTVDPSVRSYGKSADAGNAGGTGATRPDSPGASLYRPTVELVANGTEAARFAQILKTAVSPRLLYVYQSLTGLWLSLSLGEVQRSRTDLHYRFSLSCVGA